MNEEQHIEVSNAPKSHRLLGAAGAVTMAGGGAFVAMFDPAKLGFLPLCPLFALTGFACPGCGLTRGFHSLFRGDIIPALDFNILLPVWAVVGAWVFLSFIALAARGRGLPMWPAWPRVLWVFLVTLIVFGVIRNVPVYPFTILFP